MPLTDTRQIFSHLHCCYLTTNRRPDTRVQVNMVKNQSMCRWPRRWCLRGHLTSSSWSTEIFIFLAIYFLCLPISRSLLHRAYVRATIEAAKRHFFSQKEKKNLISNYARHFRLSFKVEPVVVGCDAAALWSAHVIKLPSKSRSVCVDTGIVKFLLEKKRNYAIDQLKSSLLYFVKSFPSKAFSLFLFELSHIIHHTRQTAVAYYICTWWKQFNCSIQFDKKSKLALMTNWFGLHSTFCRISSSLPIDESACLNSTIRRKKSFPRQKKLTISYISFWFDMFIQHHLLSIGF